MSTPANPDSRRSWKRRALAFKDERDALYAERELLDSLCVVLASRTDPNEVLPEQELKEAAAFYVAPVQAKGGLLIQVRRRQDRGSSDDAEAAAP